MADLSGLFTDQRRYLIQKWLFLLYLFIMVVIGLCLAFEGIGFIQPKPECYKFGLITAFVVFFIVIFIPDSKDPEYKFENFLHKLTRNFFKN